MKGIILATTQAKIPGEGPAGLIRIAGSPLLERQLRMMKDQGISDVVIVAKAEDCETIQQRLKHKPRRMNIVLVHPGEDGTLGLFFQEKKTEDEQWLLMEGGLLFDDRLPGLLAGKTGEKISLLSSDTIHKQDQDSAFFLSYKKRTYVFAGCALLSTEILLHLDFSRDQKWMQGLQKLLDEKEALRFDLSEQQKYRADLRRESDFLWLPVRSPQSNQKAKKLLIAAAQKKILDWPAWLIHRPIEDWIVHRICEWQLTPNQITLITNFIALAVIPFFVTGKIGVGLILALIVGILDGLDGKQARVKHMFTRFGTLEHVFDKAYEIGWYLALAFFLHSQGFGFMPWILFAVMLAGILLDVVIVNAYQSRTGIPFDDGGPFERSFRIFAGRRNIYIWVLIPFVAIEALGISGALFEGYRIIAFYSVLTLLVRALRLMIQLSDKRSPAEEEAEAPADEVGVFIPAPDAAAVIVPVHTHADQLTQKICDVPLFLRTLLALKRSGVKSFRIVVPEDKNLREKLRVYLDNSRLSDTEIVLQRVDDPLPDESFWLLPATLVWTKGFFRDYQRSLARLSQKEPHLKLCFLEDSGKNPVPLLWIKEDHADISGLIRELQNKGIVSRPVLTKFGVVPVSVSQETAVMVHSEPDIVRAQKMLLRDNIKESDGAISRHINRRISHLATAHLIDTPVNQYSVTAIVFLIGLLAAYFTQRGDYLSIIIGTILLNLNSIADGIDGELARLRFSDSASGEWIDRISDKAIHVLFYAAIIIGYWRTHPGSFINTIGIISVGSFAVGSALLYLYGFIFKKTAGRLYIPQGSRFMQTAHRIIFGAVFGSVDLGKERRSIRSETKSSLQGWNYLIKNDILCVYFIILAFFGALYLIPVLLLPYGMFLLFMGFYAAAFLVFGSKGLWGAKNKT